MAMTVAELQVKVNADTSAAESGLASLGGTIGSVGGTLATAFGGAAIAGIAALGGALVASTAAAAGFEAQMSAVKAVSGATASEMEQLSSLALQLGADTSFSASDAAQGIEELVKAGVSIGDIMGGAASASLSLAAAGAISVGDAAEIAANAMNQFGLKGTDLAHVSDLIAGAANASAIDVNDFKFSLAAVGAVANTVGFTFDDTATAIALLGQAGIKGSDAGTSLKTMFLNLQPATKQQTALFRELGLITADGANQFFDATGKAKSLADVAGVLQTALAGQTQQQKLATLETIFGSDAIRAAAVFANEGAEGFTEMATSMSKVTAEAVAAERLNNLQGDIEQLTGSLETAGITIGTAFLPGLRSIVQGATETVNQAAPLLEAFATRASNGIGEASRQIQDAWRTAKQAFEGQWLPSDDIPPFVNAVGTIATELRTVKTVLGEMGVADTFGRAVETIGRHAGISATSLKDMAKALDILHEALGGTRGEATLLGSALTIVGDGLRILALGLGGAVDLMLTAGRMIIDLTTMVVSFGKAVVALARGDIPAMNAALASGDKAFADLAEAGFDFAERSAARVKEGFGIITGSATAGMTATERAVTTGMAAANAAVADGSAGMQRFMEANVTEMASATASGMVGVSTAVETGMATTQTAVETGMAGSVAAVETAAPQATAAAEAMGTGMAAGIEAAAPTMEAATRSGASGAVAAVEGQAGAASGAGQSVGSSIGSGMMAGIQSWVGSIASAAAGLVSSAIAAARGAADAQSPSKKTEKLGKDLAEGLEIGLNSSTVGEDMQAKIRAFIAASREYIPTAKQIARVEGEIHEIRERSQTDALFRTKDMIVVESEALRLKKDMVSKEKELLPLRHDIARATRDIEDAERGSLSVRQQALTVAGTVAANSMKINTLEKEKIPLVQQSLEIERQLISARAGSKEAERLQKEQDEIRKRMGLIDNTIAQQRLLTREQELDAASNREASTVASTAARIRKEALDDASRAQQRLIDDIKMQIDVLGAEKNVFEANEAVIKNATENEIAYRQQLIAVFTAEGKPLADRIAAGKALLEQLHDEGTISDELYNAVKKTTDQHDKAAKATAGLGSAAAEAAPQIGAAASKMDQAAQDAAEMARQTAAAAGKVDALSKSLGKLPDWFTPTGKKGSSLFEPRAAGGPVSAGDPYLVGERGPEVFVPRRSGSIVPLRGAAASTARGGGAESITINIVVGGQVSRQIVVEGYDLAVRSGWTPAGLTG